MKAFKIIALVLFLVVGLAVPGALAGERFDRGDFGVVNVGDFRGFDNGFRFFGNDKFRDFDDPGVRVFVFGDKDRDFGFFDRGFRARDFKDKDDFRRFNRNRDFRGFGFDKDNFRDFDFD